MVEGLALGHLRTLGALYRLGTLSKTAEHLGVSQQAVSQQLAKMRQIVGDPLFVRTGHGMVPTAYARRIEQPVRQVLELLNAIAPPASVAVADMVRTFRLSATDHAQQIVVGGLARALRAEAPSVRLVVSAIESAGLVGRMQQGEIDLALTTAAYVPAGLASMPLFTERYVCVAARPLAGPGQTLPLAALADHPFVVVSPNVPDLDGSAGAWFQQHGLTREVVMSVPSFFMARQFVRQSDLVAFMPSRLMPCEGLIETPLDAYPPGFEVVAAWHPSASSDPLLGWVLSQLRERFTMGL